MIGRLLLSETLDPDGALYRWISPEVRDLGWDTHLLPTQAAVHLLGPAAYSEAVVGICAELEPDLLLVHPPYDHLPASACRAIQSLGVRLVALCFDDPLFVEEWGAAGLSDLRDRFDLWCTTDLDGAAVAAGATPLRWARSRLNEAPRSSAAPADGALLIGRKRPARASLVAGLRAAGIDVLVRGAGWPAGPVDTRTRDALLRSGRVVISPNDGTGMFKARILEAAHQGAAQAIERTPDLSAYVPAGATFETWSTPEECAALVVRGGYRVDLSAHTWTTRWPELCALLDLPTGRATRGASPTRERLCAALGSVAEAQARWSAARSFYAEAGPPGLTGRARSAHAMGDWAAAAALATAALAAVEVPRASRVAAWIPAHGQGAGLGRTGMIDGRVELEAILVHALMEDGRVDEAEVRVCSLPPALRRAVSGQLRPDDVPERQAVWRQLDAGPKNR